MNIDGMNVQFIKDQIEHFRGDVGRQISQLEDRLRALQEQQKVLSSLLSLCESLCDTSSELQELIKSCGIETQLRLRVESQAQDRVRDKDAVPHHKPGDKHRDAAQRAIDGWDFN